MSDLIQISGIRSFGFHGVFEEERKNGQEFFVDLLFHKDLSQASKSDDLRDTLDYSLACELVVKVIQSGPYSLIERLAGEIANQLLNEFDDFEKVEVTVHKPMAPISVQVRDIAVTVERSR